MSFSNLPRAIAGFLQAAGGRDTSALLATFADGAVLVDGRVEYRDDAIRTWSGRFCQSGRATAHPINVARKDGRTTLTVMAPDAGGGTSGGTVAQVDWTFAIHDGKISALTIAAAESPRLPAPLAAHIVATNTFDLEALLDTFADDAVVNDQLREYQGKAAIRDWAGRDIVGNRVTAYVVGVVERPGHAIVTANVDGDYDKRGLPDPLTVTFYFSIQRDKIVQLIILRNEPDV